MPGLKILGKANYEDEYVYDTKQLQGKSAKKTRCNTGLEYRIATDSALVTGTFCGMFAGYPLRYHAA